MKLLLCVFIDLQKCFDTIDHSILLNKLNMYGFNGVTFTWFKNYLNCRKQCVKINGYTSTYLSILMGIPQGSILGPVLFLLFINDLPNCITKCECNLFADDTILYTQSSSLDEAESQLQNDIDNLMTWLDLNRLHVNASKSSCMVLSTRHNVGDINIT
jgi:retron-type reverse transcriptase